MIHARSIRHGRQRTGSRGKILFWCLPASSVVGLLILGGAASPDATMFRGGGGLSGNYTEKIKLPLSLEWQYTASIAPSNPASPAIVGNSVYYAAGNRLYC